jgi:hypothetical protein
MRRFPLALLAAPLLALPLLAQANDTPAIAKKPGWADSTDFSAVKTSYFISPDGQEGPILNKPLSAVEFRHSTYPGHTDQVDTNKFYRDSQGRMRVEGPEVILIFDPTINKTYTLHRQEKEYVELLAIYGRERKYPTQIAVFGASGYIAHTEDPGLVGPIVIQAQWGGFPGVFTPIGHIESVELGTQTINGWPCKGTRVTYTIPAMSGKSDIHVVHERWYSDDLNVLVKSTNDDPRFGFSSYELKGVVPGEPDPSLFKLPEGYTPDGFWEAPDGRGGAVGVSVSSLGEGYITVGIYQRKGPKIQCGEETFFAADPKDQDVTVYDGSHLRVLSKPTKVEELAVDIELTRDLATNTWTGHFNRGTFQEFVKLQRVDRYDSQGGCVHAGVPSPPK